MSLPENVTSSMGELARLADEMWYLAGDKSVDFSWYTKRATLSAVYASSGSIQTDMVNLQRFS
jgi:ubiquinone biosynthesis protein COQ9